MAVAAPPKTGIEKWRDLLAGNVRYMAGRPHVLSGMNVVSHRREASEGQRPTAAIVACSDSRVCPELIFDTQLAQVFTVMAAGNVVDDAGIASIEFCTTALQSSLIVVLGHTKCGACVAGIGAAQSGGIANPSNPLERLVVGVTPAAQKGLSEMPGVEGEALAECVARWNVVYVVENMLKNSESIRTRFKSGELTIIGAMYDIKYGAVATVRVFSPDDDLEAGKDAMDVYEISGAL